MHTGGVQLTERARRQYTREFKREAIELVTKQNCTVAQAAKSLDVNADVNANVLGEVAAGVTEGGQRCLSGERSPS
jgi:ribosome maturation protein Sdo1